MLVSNISPVYTNPFISVEEAIAEVHKAEKAS
jgi:hypothetical protein